MIARVVNEMTADMISLYADMPAKGVASGRIALTLLATGKNGGPEPLIHLVNTDIPTEMACRLMGRFIASKDIPLFGLIAVYYDQDISAVMIEGVTTGSTGYRASWPTVSVDGAPVMDPSRKPEIAHVSSDTLPLYSAWEEYIEAMDMPKVLAELISNIQRFERRRDE